MTINKELIDSLICDFNAAKNHIISKKEESLSKPQDTIILFIGFTILPIYLFGVSIETGNIWYMGIWIIVCIIIAIRKYISDNIRNKTWQKINSIISSHLLLIQDIEKVQSIEEVLEKLNTLKKIILVDFQYLRSQNIKIWKTIYKKEVQLCIYILINLRSDLQIRLDEQKKSLESAKSEVKSNIKWNSELASLQSSQKIRLDRQIEQFEELQKVLI